jgi:AcrR family transcriptional regulator
MAPRPRTVSDEDILAAAVRAMTRLGPVRLTLAEVAREAGLSPAAIVQRFGSKRGLLLAASKGAAEFMDDCFTQLRARHRSPLAAVIAAATDLARSTASPEEMANHLAFLQIDVGDPEFRKPMYEMSRKMVAGYKALLDDAVKAGELRRCGTAPLARTISALAGGSLINWAVFQEGTAEQWVRADVETLLAPYRAAPAAGPRRRKA